MKKICALTMMRNDEFYLRHWVAYYGAQLGMENLYVFLDGLDQEIPSWCPGVHIKAVEKIRGKVAQADKGRQEFIYKEARELFKKYDIVIGTDVDEFLVVDPKLGISLAEYIDRTEIGTCLSGLGVDVGQKLGEEDDIDGDRPFLSQRSYARLSTRYTKSSILARPVPWGSGFHRVKGHNFHIGKDLYLFHCGYFDMKRIEERCKESGRKAEGWEKHLAKRSKTIRQTTEGRARNWESWCKFARTVQTIVRPPYAWNKPAMFELVIIVRIPDRFKNIF